jgi:hypothetical protein
MEAKVIGAPVNEGVCLCKPRFTKEDVVFFKRVNNGVEGSGVLLSL